MVVSEDFRYDDLVFAIHLDDAFSLSGDNLAFTSAEYQQIDHPDSTDHDESIALTINFDVTGPGGTTSATVTLLVEADGPNAHGGAGGSCEDRKRSVEVTRVAVLYDNGGKR